MREVSSFDTFLFRRPSTLTMVNPTAPPSLILSVTTYRDYFSCSETDNFRGRYTSVLDPYAINPAASDASATPSDVARLICAVTKEGIPTAFLQWHQVKRGGGRG